MLWLVRVLGAFIGWAAGSVLRIRRAHVEAAMRAAGIDAPGRRARAMYASLGAAVVEFLWMAVRRERALAHARVEEASRATWCEAVRPGRGVVIASSHTGNWDLAACAMAREIELLVVTKRLSVRWLDRFWQSTRAAMGVRLTGAHGAVARARATLRRGGAVAMMIDQVPSPRHAVEVEFLGQRAFADRAPAALAAASGAPLVVAVSRRTARGHHELVVLDVVLPPPRPSRAWIDMATRRATLALDAFVRAYPSQWLWMHRRWKPMLATRLRAPEGSGAQHPGQPCLTPSSSPAEASTAA